MYFTATRSAVKEGDSARDLIDLGEGTFLVSLVMQTTDSLLTMVKRFEDRIETDIEIKEYIMSKTRDVDSIVIGIKDHSSQLMSSSNALIPLMSRIEPRRFLSRFDMIVPNIKTTCGLIDDLISVLAERGNKKLVALKRLLELKVKAYQVVTHTLERNRQ